MACHVCLKTGIRYCGDDAENRCLVCGVCQYELERSMKLPTTAEIKLREDMHDGYEG